MSSLVLTYDNDIDIIRDYVENGSNRAANAFVRKYQKFVYSSALRYLHDNDDAEDAAQEVFIKALKSLSSFRAESSVKTWLYRITQNVCTNITRKKKIYSIFSNDLSDENYSIPSDDAMPDERIEKMEFEKKFHDALNQLPEKQRETFALRYFEDMTYEEISGMLGTSVGGLKANYFNAVQKITKIMKSELSL